MMKAYVLFGYARQPGYAGDWLPLAVVHADDIERAAEKVGATVDKDRREEKGFLRQKRQFVSRVIRAMVATRNLRGRKRRDALRERRSDVLTRYESFRLERMPAFR